MRVGVAGFGAWGRLHAQAIGEIPGATLAAIYCHGDVSAAAARAAHPRVAVFRDYAALVAAGLDVVSIAVPNDRHAAFAVQAMEAGCDVILEKPLGISVAECDAVIDVAARTGRRVAVNHELRVSHQWGEVGKRIIAGEIGKVTHQHFSLFRHPFRPGSGGWRRDPARVGSWVLEELVHFVDLILWYGRENGPPVRLTAQGSGPGKLSDTVSVLLDWANGSTAVLTQCLAGFQHHTLLEIAGDGGAVRTWWSAAFDRSATPDFSLVVRRGEAAPEAIAVAESGEIFELKENIARALAGFRPGGFPVMRLGEAHAAVVVCLAIERSLASGAAVDLSA